LSPVQIIGQGQNKIEAVIEL